MNYAEVDYSRSDRDRWVQESPKSLRRSSFERDRARVLHSSALRRLGAKTQVLAAGTDDFVRTRLTHSLEVAQVGRELGKALGCDPDVVDAACLAHDLGHPPFGHNGERILDEIAQDIGGFEGNAQTLRLLTKLDPKVIDPVSGRAVGLNLTRAGLDASTKYPWFRGAGPVGADGSTTSKFGVYESDRDVFEWLRWGAPHNERCIEAQVMDLADDVSYSVHDVEDGIVAGAIDVTSWGLDATHEKLLEVTREWYLPDLDAKEFERAYRELSSMPYWVSEFDGSRRALAALKDMTSQLIGRFCDAVESATRSAYGRGRLIRYNASVIVPADAAIEIAILKGIAALYVMRPRELEPFHREQRQILADLVAALMEQGTKELELPFAMDWQNAPDEAGQLRVVLDQVASLTDVSAMAWHRRLNA